MSTLSTHICFATSTVADGNMSFQFGQEADVIKNRKAFLHAHGAHLNDHVCMACDHGSNIFVVNHTNAKTQSSPVADVLVTDETGLTLMLLTADCIPGIFYDPVHRVVALAHLNRKTISHRLAQKTVGFLRDQYHTHTQDLQIHFGPHIHRSSYRFPLPLSEPTPPSLKPFITKENGFAFIDITQAQIAELTDLGIDEKQISISPIDTASSPKYYSHYRSKKDHSIPAGRMATIVMLT